MAYCLWLNNRINYYERTYKKIQDFLSEIGGVTQSIMAIAIFINNFINKYIIILDTQDLLISSNISLKDLCPQRNKIKLKNTNNNINKKIQIFLQLSKQMKK